MFLIVSFQILGNAYISMSLCFATYITGQVANRAKQSLQSIDLRSKSAANLAKQYIARLHCCSFYSPCQWRNEATVAPALPGAP